MISFLIVEDDERMAMLYKLLIKAKYGDALISHAINGEEGLEKALKLDYTVILTDMRMPVMDGLEFYKGLKKERPHLSERTALISGNIKEDPNISFLAEEGCPVLLKPFKNIDLYNLVDSILNPEVDRFIKKYGYKCMRNYARFGISEKCTIELPDSMISASKSIIADTTDYSEGGLGFRYEGEDLPLGLKIDATIISLSIEKRKGIVAWSKPYDGTVLVGLQWA